jgi:hypothetical protein
VVWFIQVDGIIMDARDLPLQIQAEAFELVPQQGYVARTCFPTSILSPATGRRATRPAAPM